MIADVIPHAESSTTVDFVYFFVQVYNSSEPPADEQQLSSVEKKSAPRSLARKQSPRLLHCISSRSECESKM